MILDLRSYNLGSIIQIEGVSQRGIRWLRDHVHAEGLRSGLETGCDCDHRYGVAILEGALEAGLILEDGNTGRRASRTGGGL